MGWHGESVQSAADSTIKDVGSLGGEGGLIAMDAKGHVAFAMNSTGMYRGSVGSASPAHTAIYAKER
jgi:beta-aspartyl-peptidase (threonine type)